MTEKEAFLVLNTVPDLGPVRIKLLVEHFGTAEKVLSASGKELEKINGIGKKISDNILNWKGFFDLEEECRQIEKNNISIITIKDSCYPKLLKEIYDPPAVLYVKGSIKEEDKNAVAIVGARNASYYGINTANRFARELSGRGFTVVSGMARGVDTAAHEGVIQAKGRTIAVFGCGLDKVYPPENTELAGKIVSNGAVISEFPLGTPPLKQNFPKRNRIISGLCLGVIVVEAGKYSGSLITARLAGEQGREVFSVPGRIDAVTSQGTNILIKNGAKPVFNVDDILEEFGYSFVPEQKKEDERMVPALSGSEEKIFSFLTEEASTVDELVGACEIPVSEVWGGLVNLELKGLVKRLPGSKFIRKG